MRRRSVVEPSQYRHALLRPPDKSFRQKAKSFVWDKEEGTCMTRTPTNWLSITFYYAFFVAGVILIFYVSMKIAEAYASRYHVRPQYLLGDSPIGVSPSLNFFPIRNSMNLIWLSDDRSYSDYVNIISKELEILKEKKFNSTDLGDCAKPPFGYDKKAPCIFFRLNRIILWKPTPYRKGDSLPSNVPERVKELINSGESRVWLSCNGTTAKDRDHITQDFFEFQGPKGITISPYPFDGQANFLDPVVALKFTDDKSHGKILYSFTCFAWSKGLDTSKSKAEVNYYFE